MDLNKKKSFLYAWDRIGIAFNLLMGGILIFFHKGFDDWYQISLIHLAIIFGIFSLAFLYQRWPNRLTRFIRFCYPIFITGFYYSETQDYIFIIFDRWFDGYLIDMETALFGSEITLWTEKFSVSWLTELLLLGYLSYYPLVILGPLYIYLRASRRLFFRMMFSYVLTFSLSLPLFFLFPTEGPRWHLKDMYQAPLPSGFFVDTVYGIMKCCAVHGGAMPSTHTAISLVFVYCFYKMNRILFWSYLPFFIGLLVGTFWGRFHYFSDTVVGAGIAIVSIWISPKFSPYEKREFSQDAVLEAVLEPAPMPS